MVHVGHARHLQRVIGSDRRYFFAGAVGLAIGACLKPPADLFPMSLCVGTLTAAAWSALLIWRPQWDRQWGFPLVILPPMALSSRYGSGESLFSLLSLLPTIIGSLLLILALAIMLFRGPMRRAAERYLRAALAAVEAKSDCAGGGRSGTSGCTGV